MALLRLHCILGILHAYGNIIKLINSRWLCVQANDRFRVQNAKRVGVGMEDLIPWATVPNTDHTPCFVALHLKLYILKFFRYC